MRLFEYKRSVDSPKYFEIKGCAYRLIRDEKIVREGIPDPTDCSRVVDYLGYRAISVHQFYATSELDE